MESSRGLADEVKYMVSLNDDVYYPNLQFDHGNRYWKRAFNHTGMVLRDSRDFQRWNPMSPIWFGGFDLRIGSGDYRRISP